MFLRNIISNKKENFIKYSYSRNGILKNFIRNYNERKSGKTPGFELNQKIYLLFLFLILLRTFKSITVSDEDFTLLMRIGRPWHLLGTNYIHNEVMIIIWTLFSISVYIFVINSPINHYKWIEIYAFLNGVLTHQQIGKHLSFFKLFSWLSKLKFSNFLIQVKINYKLWK